MQFLKGDIQEGILKAAEEVFLEKGVRKVNSEVFLLDHL